jgi:hypothetical protein
VDEAGPCVRGMGTALDICPGIVPWACRVPRTHCFWKQKKRKDLFLSIFGFYGLLCSRELSARHAQNFTFEAATVLGPLRPRSQAGRPPLARRLRDQKQGRAGEQSRHVFVEETVVLTGNRCRFSTFFTPDQLALVDNGTVEGFFFGRRPASLSIV